MMERNELLALVGAIVHGCDHVQIAIQNAQTQPAASQGGPGTTLIPPSPEKAVETAEKILNAAGVIKSKMT
jgi:hypothetical protein